MQIVSLDVMLNDKLMIYLFLMFFVVFFFNLPKQIIMVTWYDHPLSDICGASFVNTLVSRGHSFNPVLMKLAQNVCSYEI